LTDYLEVAKTWASLPEETKRKLLSLQADLQDISKDEIDENPEPEFK
jgi:hypothetical protein